MPSACPVDTIELQRIARIENDNWWYRERREILSAELLRFSVPGTAVDIGAASGACCRVLAEQGWDATAIDLLEVAGPSVAKRAVPALGGVVALLLALRFLVRRRRKR